MHTVSMHVQTSLDAGARVSPCTDSFRFCPIGGVTFPAMSVPSGTVCWKGSLVFPNDPHCTPCHRGEMIPVLFAGVVDSENAPASTSAGELRVLLLAHLLLH